jgi:copper(I)-binding protein
MGLLAAAAALMWVSLAHTTAIAGMSAESPAIRVEEAWIRWLPAGVPSGGYATLINIGDRPVILIAASSPDYGEVSLHRTLDRGGTVDMVPVAKITINPHSSVNFAAMGYHFMLMQPSKSRKPGDRVPITLRFADGASLLVPFEVRR